MIKFFRKIRQKLLSENKFSKYLIYAIGEIILVVIGILIALQINNWNENKKLQNEEIRFLKNFKQSITNDLENNSLNSHRYLLTKEAINKLIKHFEQDLPYHDSLSYYFGRITQAWSPKINMEVFETLKSNNLNLISNDNLRNKLVSYYSWSNNVLNKDVERYIAVIDDASFNIFNTRFNALWNGNYKKYNKTKNIEDLELRMIPNNYNELKKNKEFLYFLRSLKNQYFWLIEDNQNSINKQSIDLIKTIDSELNHRN